MSIKTWPKFERPREKLLKKGAASLSDAELLAIFLRTGIRGKSALDLARDLLKQFGNFRVIFNLSFAELQKIRGLGVAKYVQLKAVLEMSQRYLYEKALSKKSLTSTEETKQYLMTKLGHSLSEMFGCVFLTSQHEIITFEILFNGSIDRIEVYPREIIRAVIKYNAAAIILVHNHPSGDPKPSQLDLQLTEDLKKALDYIDVKVLDHFVIGANNVVSFVEQGFI